MKVLLVEDDPSTGQFLSAILTAHRYTVDHVTNGKAGLDLAFQGEYAAILLDVVLPELDGLSVCRQLRQQGCQIPILMLTAKDSAEDMVTGLDAGADDYVTKPCEPSQLIARVRALLRRPGGTLATPILTWGALCLDPTLIQVTYQHRVVPLSPKEYSLLELFLRHPQRIFSRSSIIDHLWSIDDTPTDAAVTNLIKDLRRRLKAAGMAEELIETVYRLGYRLKALPQETKEDESKTAQPVNELKEPNQGLVLIDQVIQDFKASLDDRIAILDAAARSLQSDGFDLEQLQNAQQEAHRLAGGLGTFGYTTASQTARAIEHLLTEESELQTALGEPLSHRLADLVEELKQEIAKTPASPNVSESVVEEISRVLVVDDDSLFITALQRSANTQGLEVEVTASRAAALETMAQNLPEVILLNLDAEFVQGQRLEFLQEVKAKYPKVPILTLAQQDSLSDRVAVSRLGGNRYILKSAAVEEVLEAIAQALPRTVPPDARVMIVDDDPLVLKLLTHLLEPWGLQVTALQDPDRFWQVLTAANPDVLLLDLEMPTFNGVELCRVVRQDSKYSDLPILVVTAHTDIDHIQQVFSAGADDFISKPVVGPELVTRVINRVERSRMQRQLLRFQREQHQNGQQDTQIDSLTQVANRHHLSSFLDQTWQKLTSAQQFLSLVLCDIDHFKAYNENYGQQSGDICLQRVARAIQASLMASTDLVARYSGGTFAIVLPYTNLNGALSVVARIQQEIANLQLTHPASPSHSRITLSLGITGTIPTANTSPAALTAIAEQALSAAKARGRNTYCLYSL